MGLCIKPLIKVADMGMPAVALTDFNNFWAYKILQSSTGGGRKTILGQMCFDRVNVHLLSWFVASDSGV